MSTVMTQAQAAELLRRNDLPCVVGWSWFDHATSDIVDSIDAGAESAAREMITFAKRLIKDAGGNPESEA